MKRRFILGIGVLTVGALFFTGCSSNGGSITSMDAHKFSAKTQEAGVITLDVRTPDEFSQGHIAGAMNIDVEAATFVSKVSKLDKSKSYAVYCHSGRRSAIATEQMKKLGFQHLFNLENGISDWMAQGMGVVTS